MPVEEHTLGSGRRPRVRVVETVAESTGGVSLADAKVVVSGGRGVGSAEGFAIIEELAGLLGGAVGCSRVVTSAGWRPHTDQVGQTGTKVSPDLYVACGISGATQHIAGCKGAKKILAINDDPEAPILANADYAVIGDLHEIVPAISAELRKARAIASLPARSRSRALLVVAGGLFARRALLLVRLVRTGKPVERLTTFRARVRNEAVLVLGQRKLLQRLVPGLMHAFIFWGFIVLFPTIVIAMIGAVDRHADDSVARRAGLVRGARRPVRRARAAGVVTAVVIRKVVRPARFEGSHRGEADLILAHDRRGRHHAACWHGARIAPG